MTDAPQQQAPTPDVIDHEQELPLVCVKFEEVLATKMPDGSIGPPRDSAAGFMKQLHDLGYLTIVYSPLLSIPDVTQRTQAASMIEDWLHRNLVEYGEVWMQEGVPPASAFVSPDAVPIQPNPYPEQLAQALQMIAQKVPPPAMQQQPPADQAEPPKQ